MLLQQASQISNLLVGPQIFRGDIDGDLHVNAFTPPAFGLANDTLDHPSLDFRHQAIGFRDLNELTGREYALGRMTPADERLAFAKRIRSEVDNRLEFEIKLMINQRRVQFFDKRNVLLQLRIDGRRIEAHGFPASMLGGIHRRVGKQQNFVHRFPVAGE